MLMDGIEPPTREASTPRSTTELHQHLIGGIGRDRTYIFPLKRRDSTS